MLLASDTSDGAAEAAGFVLTRPIAVLAIVLGTWLVTRLSRRLIHRLVRRVAVRNGNDAESASRSRLPRLFGETVEQAEDRRRQRVEAASRMISHVFSLAAWITALIAVLHVLDIDPVLMLTSAGFIGAGLAIGGQHQVRDWLSGLSILLEDRFGVGDLIAFETATGGKIEGVVEHVGALSTRIRSGETTWHLTNSSLGLVQNRSQVPVVSALEVAVGAGATGAEAAGDVIASTVERAVGGPHLTGMVLVDAVRTAGAPDGDGDTVQVELRTSRPLSTAQQEHLQRLVESELARARPADATT